MEKVLLLIAVLACPLGMLVMSGIAWVSAKTFGKRSERDPGEAHRTDLAGEAGR